MEVRRADQGLSTKKIWSLAPRKDEDTIWGRKGIDVALSSRNASRCAVGIVKSGKNVTAETQFAMAA